MSNSDNTSSLPCKQPNPSFAKPTEPLCGLDKIVQRSPFLIVKGRILSHQPLGDDFYFLTLQAPSIAPLAQPGQFLHIAIPGAYLKRPFSIFSASEKALSIYYRVVGRGTEILSQLPTGQELEITGPLGTPFPPIAKAPWILVGGGYGIGPLRFLLRRQQKTTDENFPALFLYGAKSARYLKLREALEPLGKVLYATEDGSLGERGVVTDILQKKLPEANPAAVYACGPMPMLKKVAEIVRPPSIPCFVSTEERMGCGLGACLGCTLPILRGGVLMRLRTCTEGPVFPAEEVFYAAKECRG